MTAPVSLQIFKESRSRIFTQTVRVPWPYTDWIQSIGYLAMEKKSVSTYINYKEVTSDTEVLSALTTVILLWLKDQISHGTES